MTPTQRMSSVSLTHADLVLLGHRAASDDDVRRLCAVQGALEGAAKTLQDLPQLIPLPRLEPGGVHPGPSQWLRTAVTGFMLDLRLSCRSRAAHRAAEPGSADAHDLMRCSGCRSGGRGGRCSITSRSHLPGSLHVSDRPAEAHRLWASCSCTTGALCRFECKTANAALEMGIMLHQL
jgi:hypothetical protein